MSKKVTSTSQLFTLVFLENVTMTTLDIPKDQTITNIFESDGKSKETPPDNIAGNKNKQEHV